MISIIYGAKGSGKTKRIIDAANDRARLSKGSVVYITDCADHSSVVDNGIRFIDINHYDVTDENGMLCFIKGLLAGNYDITDVYIDGLASSSKRTYPSWRARAGSSTFSVRSSTLRSPSPFRRRKSPTLCAAISDYKPGLRIIRDSAKGFDYFGFYQHEKRRARRRRRAGGSKRIIG